jgi:hypothetical protein
LDFGKQVHSSPDKYDENKFCGGIKYEFCANWFPLNIKKRRRRNGNLNPMKYANKNIGKEKES